MRDTMTAAHGAGPGSVRWRMLAVISLGIIALTLNWFDVATAFPLIGAEFKVGLGSLSYLISLYIVGYGLTHIPGGMLATAIGMKKTLVLGLLVQGLAGIMSGLSYSYAELAFFRVLSGVGGSVFIAVGTAAVVVWFRDKDVTLALGITGGAAFSVGAEPRTAGSLPWDFTLAARWAASGRRRSSCSTVSGSALTAAGSARRRDFRPGSAMRAWRCRRQTACRSRGRTSRQTA